MAQVQKSRLWLGHDRLLLVGSRLQGNATYRELHQPNLNLSGAAKKIEMSPPGEDIAYTVASPDLWNRRQETGASGGRDHVEEWVDG